MHASLCSPHLWVLFRKLNSWIYIEFEMKKWEHYILMHSKNLQHFSQKSNSALKYYSSVLSDHYLKQEAERFTNTWSPLNADLQLMAQVSRSRVPSSDVSRFSPRLVLSSVSVSEGGAISLMNRCDKLGPGVSRSSPFSGSTVNCASYSICQNCPLITYDLRVFISLWRSFWEYF